MITFWVIASAINGALASLNLMAAATSGDTGNLVVGVMCVVAMCACIAATLKARTP